jgi:hypothetical protein
VLERGRLGIGGSLWSVYFGVVIPTDHGPVAVSVGGFGYAINLPPDFGAAARIKPVFYRAEEIREPGSAALRWCKQSLRRGFLHQIRSNVQAALQSRSQRRARRAA